MKPDLKVSNIRKALGQAKHSGLRTLVDLEVLLALAELDCPTVKEVHALTVQAYSTVSRVLWGLSQARLVTHSPSDQDRRIRVLSLTAAGLALVKQFSTTKGKL